jgi:hypothetical protein
MTEASFGSRKKNPNERGEGDISHLSLDSVNVSTVGEAIAFCNFEGKKKCARGKDVNQTLKWLNKNFDSKKAEEWKGKISVFNSTYKDSLGRYVYPGVMLVGNEFIITKHIIGDSWTTFHRLVIEK